MRFVTWPLGGALVGILLLSPAAGIQTTHPVRGQIPIPATAAPPVPVAVDLPKPPPAPVNRVAPPPAPSPVSLPKPPPPPPPPVNRVALPAPYNLVVGSPYTDCSGQRVFPPGVHQYTCDGPGRWLAAHNWSTGRDFYRFNVGTKFTNQGALWVINSRQVVTPQQADAMANSGSYILALSTCIGLHDSLRLVLTAIPA